MAAGAVLPMFAPRLGLLHASPHAHAPFGVTRKVGHGAGAAFLLLSGAGALGGAPAVLPTPSLVDYSSLDGIANGMLSGAFNSPLQIAAAMLVFITAGRCIARFLGLALVLLAFFLHSQGVTLADVWQFAGTMAYRFSAAADAFANPPAPLST